MKFFDKEARDAACSNVRLPCVRVRRRESQINFIVRKNWRRTVDNIMHRSLAKIVAQRLMDATKSPGHEDQTRDPWVRNVHVSLSKRFTPSRSE